MFLEKIHKPKDLKSLTLYQLKDLANEVREYLIDSQARTGGHIGPNLGVVELTIALHYIFDSPYDKIIWDVGHQCYVHKMLTGRLNAMRTMRQNAGSPGFPAKDESPHDVLDSSHGGSSLSVAIGIALANKQNNVNDLPIAVIGDGALVEGMVHEALNQIGNEKIRMLIILNDNGRAIDANIGAIPNYLSQLHIGEKVNDKMFTPLGIEYIGPLDGHNLKSLIMNLKKLKNITKPTVLHIKTKKGMGLPYAEKDPIQLHFSFPFKKETGELITEPIEKNIFYKPKSKFNAVMIGQKITEITKKNKDIVIITPATRGALELHKCFKEVPERCFDVGMAEQHAITLAAGLSVGGMKPIVCFQSTFFQRAFDQLVHDICVNKLPVLFILARSGLAGLDHATHHAPLDLSYLSCVPNLKMFFPIDHIEFNIFLENISKKWINSPTILLFPYGTIDTIEPNNEEKILLSEDIFDENNVGIILSTAGRIKNALKLKKMLFKHKINFAILNISQIKPLNQKLFIKILNRYQKIVTMEENVTRGGFGSSVCEFAIDNGYKPEIIRVTLGDVFLEHGMRSYLYKKYNIDENSILKKIRNRWNFKSS
jgi:1-deoxy-D-xylulose-5-phosphate synthase